MKFPDLPKFDTKRLAILPKISRPEGGYKVVGPNKPKYSGSFLEKNGYYWMAHHVGVGEVIHAERAGIDDVFEIYEDYKAVYTPVASAFRAEKAGLSSEDAKAKIVAFGTIDDSNIDSFIDEFGSLLIQVNDELYDIIEFGQGMVPVLSKEQDNIIQLRQSHFGLMIDRRLPKEDWLNLKPHGSYSSMEDVQDYFDDIDEFFAYPKSAAGWSYSSDVVDALIKVGYQPIFDNQELSSSDHLREIITQRQIEVKKASESRKRQYDLSQELQKEAWENGQKSEFVRDENQVKSLPQGKAIKVRFALFAIQSDGGYYEMSTIYLTEKGILAHFTFNKRWEHERDHLRFLPLTNTVVKSYLETLNQ